MIRGTMIRPSLLIVCVACMSCAAFGQAPSKFEVASVKRASSGANPGDIPRNMDASPGHFAMFNVPLRYALEWAYNMKDFEITGPDWIKADERYDIVAKAAAPVSDQQIRLMLQALLIERFQMKTHTEKKELSVYVLLPGKATPKVKESSDGAAPSISGGPSGASFHNQPISRFTFMLTRRLDRPVLDMTGLKGAYDFTVDLSGLGFGGNPPPAESTGPSIFTAVQNDLGLKLEARKQPIDILMIDSVNKIPTAN
jgi:uncharacterized protein (TIGR03435 family)